MVHEDKNESNSSFLDKEKETITRCMHEILDFALGATCMMNLLVKMKGETHTKSKGVSSKMENETEQYTGGQLAKLIGVSYKTIRHYVQIGLLSPEKITEKGYRLYGKKSLEKLQRIMMLKYLGFSLEDIRQMMTKGDVVDSLDKQEKLILAQMKHLESVHAAIVELKSIKEDQKWEKMLEIMQLIARKEEIIQQYLEKDNLQKRINIHAYSTAKVNWYDWLYDQMDLKENMKVLDVGCGNAMLWLAMGEKLPRGLQITLLDNSEGMLEAAKRNLKSHEALFNRQGISFIYQIMDATQIKEESTYDRIMANHMLYHIEEHSRPEVIKTLSLLLKQDGKFIASTIGRGHMKELFELLMAFDQQIEIPMWMSEGFSLENGAKQLEPFFSKVSSRKQENDLMVPDPMAVYDYAHSLPGNMKSILAQKDRAFRTYLEKRISKERPFFIHKETGAFVASKNK